MIEIIENKNFFNVDAEGLVCTTNTKGIQGKGIALEFKKRFPNNYLAYKKYCDSGSAKPGTIFTFIRNENPKYIFTFLFAAIVISIPMLLLSVIIDSYFYN